MPVSRVIVSAQEKNMMNQNSFLEYLTIQIPISALSHKRSVALAARHSPMFLRINHHTLAELVHVVFFDMCKLWIAPVNTNLSIL